MKRIIFLFLIPILVFAIWLWPDEYHSYPIPSQLLGLAWPEPVEPADLATKYANRGLRILVVPGHDNEHSGTEFGGLREADLTLAAAEQLRNYLQADGHFIVATTRDFKTGEYLPEFANYFRDEREEILSFRTQLRQKFVELVSTDEVEERTIVEHNFAPAEVGLRLYGINKWANEHDVDLVLHLHFNDYPGRRWGTAGRHNGFSVYIPERQYPNAEMSSILGAAVFNELKQVMPVSSLPLENVGLVEDQELIAIGSHGSRDGASFLVEYGYIYEPQLVDPDVRGKMLPEIAWQTYAGLKKHFDPYAPLPVTLLRPTDVQSELKEGIRGSGEVLVLQRTLLKEKMYPPAGKTLRDCPLTGNFGGCTREAVKAFQAEHEITPQSGVVGEKTRKKLNELYAVTG